MWGGGTLQASPSGTAAITQGCRHRSAAGWHPTPAPHPGVQRFTTLLFKLLGHVGQAATVNKRAGLPAVLARGPCRAASRLCSCLGSPAGRPAESRLEAKLGWGFPPASLLGVARGTLPLLLASAARRPCRVGLEAVHTSWEGQPTCSDAQPGCRVRFCALGVCGYASWWDRTQMGSRAARISAWTLLWTGNHSTRSECRLL